MNKRPDASGTSDKNNTHPAISILIIINIFITGVAFCCTLFSFLSKAGIISFISLAVTILSFVSLLLLVIIENFFSMISGIEFASNRAIELLETIAARSFVPSADEKQEKISDLSDENALIAWRESQIKKADVALTSGKITQEKYNDYVAKVKSFTKVPEDQR
ncbi:MAG: hypothetical protein J6S14_17235 [Clostridia bacterium]|nr:hypothetical protein [Clostridia bacterium]